MKSYFLYSIGYLDHSAFPISAGGLNLLLNFQKGGLDRISIFSGGLLGKREVNFSGGFNFYIKK